MKVISEHLKRVITYRILVIITSLIPLGLLPVLNIIFNIELIPSKKGSWDGFLCGIVIGISLISLACFSKIKLPRITLRNLLKLKYLLTHGIYSKAKVIDIQETDQHVTLYFQLLHPEYSNVILEKKISLSEYYNQSTVAKKVKETPIKKYKNSQKQSNNVSLVKPKVIENNINDLNEYNYLTVNSIVSILYDPNKDNNWMICSFWDIWRKNHWLDDYSQDNIQNEEIHKQRTISKLRYIQNIFKFYKILIIIALLILAISPLHKGFLMIVAIIECWLFLSWFIWTYFYIPKHYNFYEYSIATRGTITSANEITVHSGRTTTTFWLYTYTFKTDNNIPYQGQMKVYQQPNIRPYTKNCSATILYNPSCILQNCLAFYYPYSWIQPEETKNLYQIPIIQPDIEESVLE